MTETTSQPRERSASAVSPRATNLTGYRRGFDVAYGYLLCIFTVAVIVQIYLAGVGAFGHKAKGDGAFNPHENLGHILGIAAVVLFVVALIAHVSKNTMVGAFVVALLTEVAQEGLAHGGHHSKWVGGLHAFDALLILAASIWLLYAWRQRQRTN